MRSVALSLVSAVALASSAASAADVYSQPGGGGLKDGPMLVPVNMWAGYYTGVNGGGAWNANNQRADVFDINVPKKPFFDQFGGADPSGGFVGTQSGYNWQWGRFVLGVESDTQFGDVSDSGITSPTISSPRTGFASVDSELKWFSTLRGRIGYSFNRLLIYGTGGFAAGGIRDRIIFNSNPTYSTTKLFDLRNDQTATGFAAGGGLEYAFSPKWSIKAEYQFISLSTDRLNGSFVDYKGVHFIRTNDFDHDFNTVRVGLNYHFHEYCPLPYK